MPLLLRRKSIRMFEASCDALAMAVMSYGMPERTDRRDGSTRNAMAIGFTGVAADLSMKAVLFQAYGKSGVVNSDDTFKTVGMTLSDFRSLLSNATGGAEFLTHGLDDPEAHLEDIRNSCQAFRLLCTARAEALHAAIGASRDVTAALIDDVCALLDLLARSSRLCPYLQGRPGRLDPAVEREVLVDDLARRLSESTGAEARGALRSLFLVLPDVPPQQPRWIDAFDRLSVTPRVGDVELLLNVLGSAEPAGLVRQAATGAGYPVRVSPDDEAAMPISPQFLRRSFTNIQDQWAADVATANGRLDQGVADFPPADAVLGIAAVGLEQAGIPPGGTELTGHQAWPSVAASLNKRGTPGPYWFLVQALGPSERRQLVAYLDRAAELTGVILERRLHELRSGLQVLENPENTELTTRFDSDFTDLVRAARERRERLPDALERSEGTPREPPGALAEHVHMVLEDDVSIGYVLGGIAKGDIYQQSAAAGKFWARILAEAATEGEDIPGLVSVLRVSSLQAAHTAARKAIRRADALAYGPLR